MDSGWKPVRWEDLYQSAGPLAHAVFQQMGYFPDDKEEFISIQNSVLLAKELPPDLYEEFFKDREDWLEEGVWLWPDWGQRVFLWSDQGYVH